jgi:hypothetical protein
MWIEKALEYEARIVWLEDISRLAYVRQGVYWGMTRRGKPKCPAGKKGRVVGYAELYRWYKSDSRVYQRRVFWLKNYDRDSGDPTYRRGAPAEAVDPKTVKPGVFGELTDCAWGGSRDRCA